MTDINTQDADIQQPQQPNADPAATGENKGKLFTQDEVNRIVSERLNRERERAAQAAAQATETAPDDDTARRRAELTEAENRIKCKEFLLDNKHPAALLDLYDTKDFEAFKSHIEKLLKAFPQIGSCAGSPGGTGSKGNFPRSRESYTDEKSALDAVFKPKF